LPLAGDPQRYIHALAAERKKLSQLRSTGIEKDEK
jgi:hypothetical protein